MLDSPPFCLLVKDSDLLVLLDTVGGGAVREGVAVQGHAVLGDVHLAFLLQDRTSVSCSTQQSLLLS